MNERIFEKSLNTLGIAFMAGRVLTALGTFQKKKEEHGQTSLSMPPSYIESKKALEEALAFIKKVNSVEDALQQAHLNLSSLEAFELYAIALGAVRSERENVLKKIENTVEAILKDNINVEANDVEDVRVFFSQLMHFASSESSRLLMKEQTPIWFK